MERPADGAEFPVLTLTEKKGFVFQADRFKKRLALEDTSGYKIVRRNDIAFNPYLLWAGAVAQNTICETGVISPLYPTFRPKPGFDASYLAELLLSPWMISKYDGISFGSVPRRRRSSVTDFLNLEIIPPPRIEEQQRIAVILNRVNKLRTKRRQLIARLDTLPNSVFMEMFGDPDFATKTVPLGAVATLTGGRNLVADDSDAQTPYRVLKISAVTSGHFRPSESKPLPLEYQPPAAHFVRAGDLLMSRANTSQLVGAVAYVGHVGGDIVLPDKIWRFEWRNSSSVPTFYRALFQTATIRRKISRMASGTGGSMKNISKAKLADLELPVVGFADQQRFARYIKAIEDRRSHFVRAIAAEDELHKSLQRRAFRGEL